MRQRAKRQMLRAKRQKATKKKEKNNYMIGKKKEKEKPNGNLKVSSSLSDDGSVEKKIRDKMTTVALDAARNESEEEDVASEDGVA